MGADRLLDLDAAITHITQAVALTEALRARVGGAEPTDLLDEARAFLRKLGQCLAADKLDWREATKDWRLFYGDGRKTPSPTAIIQEAMFATLFDGRNEGVLFPAAGLDTDFLETRPSIVTVGPYDSKRACHINKCAEDLDDDDIAQLQTPRTLVLKGLQSLVRPKDLIYLVTQIIKPSRIVACGTAKPRSKHDVGYPSLDATLRSALISAGFKDVTAEQVAPAMLDRLQKAHGLLATYFRYGEQGGWFPLTMVEVFSR